MRPLLLLLLIGLGAAPVVSQPDKPEMQLTRSFTVDSLGACQGISLDGGNLLQVIEDDACVQGTRPEYVEYDHKWYVATADYGNRANEVRLYDPAVLRHAGKTTDKGVLFKKFSCGPWVQNLQWIPEKGLLLLIQNKIEGRQWRFTYVDLKKSLESGKAEVVKMEDTMSIL